jgi:2-haloacid dehalogenase
VQLPEHTGDHSNQTLAFLQPFLARTQSYAQICIGYVLTAINRTDRGAQMTVDRRHVLHTSLSLAAGLLAKPAWAARVPRFKAVAFDGLAVFDSRPIAALAEITFPGKGAELMSLWRIRQFEYTWLRTLAGSYADFMRVTEESLLFATKSLKLELRGERRDQFLRAFLELRAWPDAAPALRKLRSSGFRLAFLSNFTPAMLDGSINASGLADVFEHVISTDRVRTYKPAPRAYQLGVSAFGLPKEQILFVAFAGWDAAGAKTFGYPTYWVNRLASPPEELGATSDGEGSTLNELLTFVGL